MANPLERKLRDSHGAASHRWVSAPLYETLGGILFGKEPDSEFSGQGGPRLEGNFKLLGSPGQTTRRNKKC